MREGERRGRKVFLRRAWLQTRVTWPAQVSARERLLHWCRLSPSGAVTVTGVPEPRTSRPRLSDSRAGQPVSETRVLRPEPGAFCVLPGGRRPTGTQARPPAAEARVQPHLTPRKPRRTGRDCRGARWELTPAGGADPGRLWGAPLPAGSPQAPEQPAHGSQPSREPPELRVCSKGQARATSFPVGPAPQGFAAERHSFLSAEAPPYFPLFTSGAARRPPGKTGNRIVATEGAGVGSG